MRLLCYSFIIALLTAPATLRAQPTFTDVTDGDLLTPIVSWGASWVDVDGDGDLDLFASRLATSGGNRLYLNEGGTFTRAEAGELTAARTPGSIGNTWADYDNDGDLDAYVVGGSGFSSGSGRLYRNEGGVFNVVDAGPIAPDEDNRGWTAAWGDTDDDGHVDLVVAHPRGFVGTPSQRNHFFHNEGDGSFTRITEGPVAEGLAPYTVPSWSDYDLDGDLDLFIGSGPVSSTGLDNLYENDGAGTFTRIETAPIATDLRDGQVMNWVDFDNDGDLDLYVTNFSATPTNDFYRNDDGTYVPITEGTIVEDTGGFGLANTWGDLDNDGDLDAFVTTGGAAVDRLYSNDGDGTFTRVTSAPLTTLAVATSGATLGDYDGDGDLDLAVTQQGSGGPVRLYRNDGDDSNGWLKLNLVGTISNAAAIGAQVRATATIGGESVTQFREVSAQNTFAGQNALTVHFGLGDATAVETLEITWPSGTVETYPGIAPNRFLQVTEGEGIVPVANEPTETAAPNALGLTAAYPNPFADTATIRYTVPAGPVRLIIYDVLGRRVRTLVDHVQPAGTHTTSWNGTDEDGRLLSAGIYLYRLEADSETLSRSLTLLR